MEAERKRIVKGHKVEEFYWNGRMVVYVDNCGTPGTFEDICALLERSK